MNTCEILVGVVWMEKQPHLIKQQVGLSFINRKVGGVGAGISQRLHSEHAPDRSFSLASCIPVLLRMTFTCKKHIDNAIDDFVDLRRVAPDILLVNEWRKTDDTRSEIECDFCTRPATYVVRQRTESTT